MAKKIKIQHLYTTTGTTAPTGNLALDYGEISISHTRGQEAIFIMSDENDGEVKFIPKTQIVSLIDTKLGEAGVATEGVISALTANLENHITGNTADSTNLGHVKLVNEDINDGKFTTGNWDGYATGVKHTHSQYLTGVTAGSGITVDANGVSINDKYQGKIASGVTAYNWGNHADGGYAKNDDLTAHTDDKKVHITNDEREKWDATTDRLNLFLDESGTTESALDSIIEFQKWFETHGTSASTMQTAITKNAADISTISGVVAGHTTAITQNNNNISSLVTSASTNATKIQSLSQTIGQVSTNVTAINDKIGSGFTPSNTITSEIKSLKDQQVNFVTSVIGSGNINATQTDGVGRQFTVTHTTAGTQKDEITATNNPTGLSFGSEFKIVDNIGYDANGHVVSGSTQTLKLPFLPTGTTTSHGVVKLSNTTYESETAALAGGWSTLVGVAASIIHTHSQYAKSSDLGMTIDNGITIISCGTY